MNTLDSTPTVVTPPVLSRGEVAAVWLVAVFAAGVGALGLASSFEAVTAAGARWGFATPEILPIGIDTAIPVFTAVNLLLIRTDMPLSWVRFVPWGLTFVTCWLNIAAGSSVSAKLAHGTMPLLWVVLSEVAAHVYASRIGAVTGRRMEKIRRSRWILAFPSTFALWRRMTLWEITSYGTALDRERDRQLARADLRQEHGRRWRKKTPHRTRVLLRLGELAPTTPETNQDESPDSWVKRSGSELERSIPAPVAARPVTRLSYRPVRHRPRKPRSIPAARPIGPRPAPVPEPIPVPAVKAVAAAPVAAPRRATGRVPQAARTRQPTRTPDQLLTEARQLTAGWPASKVTAEALRIALHIGPAKARTVRDALRTEQPGTP